MSDRPKEKFWVGCIDDDRPFLESASAIVSRSLKERGLDDIVEVEVASSADEFQELANEMAEEGAELALVITDQIMPECSGLELIERVKPDHPLASFVLLTGYAGLESARYAINQHLLDRYVHKPVDNYDHFGQMVADQVAYFRHRRIEQMQQEEIQRQAEELRLANVELKCMKRTAEHVAYISSQLRTLDLDEVLDMMVVRAAELFGAESCLLFVPDHGGRAAQWSERRVRCLAEVPPSGTTCEALSRALASGEPVVCGERGHCLGAVDQADDATGCIVMPVRLGEHGTGDATDDRTPAMLCMCGIKSSQDISSQEMNYRATLINDILGANVANALSYSETKRQATEDSLTGIKTRRVFDEMLREEWDRSQRYDTQFCLALIDADHLKQANDTCGHLAGDEMLKTIARLIQASIRTCDTAARYGGDEFVILLPETPMDGAMVLTERVKQAIETTPVPALAGLRDDGEAVCASVSVGLSISCGHSSAEAALISADRALYASKRNGRGRITVADLPGEGEGAADEADTSNSR
jgi:diguanylate cyclase (GGDEF)-like protein